MNTSQDPELGEVVTLPPPVFARQWDSVARRYVLVRISGDVCVRAADLARLIADARPATRPPKKAER